MVSKTYFITAYMEHLLKQGLKHEEVYVGDASRFLRYLLSTAPEDAVQKFITASGTSPSYHRRLSSSLNRFLAFAQSHLDISSFSADVDSEDQEAL